MTNRITQSVSFFDMQSVFARQLSQPKPLGMIGIAVNVRGAIGMKSRQEPGAAAARLTH